MLKDVDGIEIAKRGSDVDATFKKKATADTATLAKQYGTSGIDVAHVTQWRRGTIVAQKDDAQAHHSLAL